jgi:hypothetical protein
MSPEWSMERKDLIVEWDTRKLQWFLILEKGVIKCVKTTFLLQFIFRLFQEFGRYMIIGENVMSVFFLCNCNYNYNEMHVSHGYIFLTKVRLFLHKVCFIINKLFLPLCEKYASYIKLFIELFMHAVFLLIVLGSASFRG